MDQPSRNLVIGILAPVDAGKTTLAESILYNCKSIRKWGRVDNKDAFLDTYELEKSRGITIFAKQAEFDLGERHVNLLDTPGHVDFSAEMERTLQVLDAAILVISGADGVQGHVITLWRLLQRYEVPAFIFINKMDQPGTDRAARLRELQEKLSEHCIDFSEDRDEEVFGESLAMCDEVCLEHYLETGEVEEREIRRLIRERKAFPCHFGSALKEPEGVQELLATIDRYLESPGYGEAFGAKVFKITRDAQGTRLTYLKVTGGRLKVKQLLTNRREGMDEDAVWEEKADQIRIYSGAGFRTVDEAEAGSVCAVTGLTKTFSGEGLGAEASSGMPILEPVLTYQIQLPEGCDVHGMFVKLSQLEEEIPELHIAWQEELQEIHAQVMGEVQIEILKSMIAERYGVEVEFGQGSIVYKETICNAVEGVGHFEPLRHYAEVHLLLEPGEPGSGLQFGSACSEDILDKNWQRLILTHLEEKKHRGVLTGSEITDMRITLVAGRAHVKHTEGGDFRQSTYRAVRQGLMQAENVLLEPVYEFRLEVPNDRVGRALSDIQKMQGSFEPPVQEGEISVIVGQAPVSTMGGYQAEVTAYSRGTGHLFCTLKGYEPCHNAEEVIESIGYAPELDLENPTGSVFCTHGAGFVVPWDEVPDYMHVDSGLRLIQRDLPQPEPESPAAMRNFSGGSGVDDKELQQIFQRTYGGSGSKDGWNGRRRTGGGEKVVYRAPKPAKEPEEEYLLVDGYNIIFSWDELRELAAENIEAARGLLMDILCNYQGYRKCTLILVYDAYKVKGNPGEITKYNNIYVVYTKEAETADQYIEKTVHQLGRHYRVTVATSDALEQVIILGQGGERMSAAGLKEEVERAGAEISSLCRKRTPGTKNYLFDHLPEGMADWMEEIRLGRRQWPDKSGEQ